MTFGIASREVQFEGAAAARLTMNSDCAIVVFNDAVNNGQAQTRSFTRTFRGKKRLEDALHSFFRHAVPRVAHTQPGKAAAF
jgi:hypothetical protein